MKVILSLIRDERALARPCRMGAVGAGAAGGLDWTVGRVRLKREDADQIKHPTGLEPRKRENRFISDGWWIREAAAKGESLPRTGKCLEK